jgi:hypothetical protein
MFGARTLPEITLEEIASRVTPPETKLRCTTDDIRVQFAGTDPSVRVRVGPEDHVTLPTVGAREAFAQFLTIPYAFLDRVSGEMATYIVNGLLGEIHSEVKVRHGERGIHDILEARLDPIEPISVVEIAESIVGAEANVLEWWCSNTDFRLDVVSPEGGPVVRGDLTIGDISHGGLRYTQDLKKHTMPQVQKLIYRLVCTNGMEIADATAKMDGRGSNHEEFLTSFEITSRRLYSEVEADIDHFYQLRGKDLGDASQAVLRVAEEQGLPERVTTHLVRLVPDMIPAEGATQFDLVNLFTNAALEPGVPAGTRRRLEAIGGQVVAEQSMRCQTCAAKVG